MKSNFINLIISFLIILTVSFSQDTQERTIGQSISIDQVTDTLIDSEFERWRKQTKRCYSSESEIIQRRQIFANNYRAIIAHNNDKTQTYTMRLNDFSDMEYLEIQNKYLIPNAMRDINITQIRHTKEDENYRNLELLNAENHLCKQKQENSFEKLYPPCSWRPQAVNQVIQAPSYAASITGMAEGFNYIDNGNLVKYSEQQIVDCCGYYGFGVSGVCNKHYQALNYVMAYGLLIVSQYSSLPINNQSACRLTSPSNNGFYFTNFQYPLPSLTNSFYYLVCRQPFAVAINMSWALITSGPGIFNGQCSSSMGQANYFALLVGFAFSSSGNYWIIKASLGTNFFNAGYIYLPMSGNKCGILNFGLRAWHP